MKKHNTNPSEKTMVQTNVNIKMHRSSKKYGIRPEETEFRITKSDLKEALTKAGIFDQTVLNTLAASLMWRSTKETETKKGTLRTALYTLSNGTKTIFLKVKLFASGNFSINGMPACTPLTAQLARAIA